MLESIDLFRLAGSRMEYLAERQSVIARNIANADTPGYVAHDLTPFSFNSALTQQTGPSANAAPLTLVRTSADHLGSAPAAAAGAQIAPTAGYEEKPDGNGVSIEEQMVKAADNTNAFSLVSAAYAKTVAIMKLGIDK